MVVVRAQGFDQRLQGRALRVEFHPENTNPSLSAVNRAVLPFFPGEALADAVLAPQAVLRQGEASHGASGVATRVDSQAPAKSPDGIPGVPPAASPGWVGWAA